MFHALLLLSFLGFAQSLTCHSCDTFLNCATPFPQLCPPNTHCYTLTKHHGHEIIAKGCAHSCQSLPNVEGSFCTTCHHSDFCNDRGFGIGQGVIMNEGNAGIGGGVVVDNGYHIGHGVRPKASSTLRGVFVAAFLIFAQVFA